MICHFDVSLRREVKTKKGAEYLVKSLQSFSPQKVIYIETGGKNLGQELAKLLGIELQSLDVRYPFSRIKSPFLKAVLFIAKEALYKLTSPSINKTCEVKVNSQDRILLVDDTASSGKTLSLAIEHLKSFGVSREKIKTAVMRCGKKASCVVDFSIMDTVDLVDKVDMVDSVESV